MIRSWTSLGEVLRTPAGPRSAASSPVTRRPSCEPAPRRVLPDPRRTGVRESADLRSPRRPRPLRRSTTFAWNDCEVASVVK